MAEQTITEHIRSSLAQGKSREEIYKELLSQGLGIDAIQDAFSQLAAKEEREDTQRRTIATQEPATGRKRFDLTRAFVVIGAILIVLAVVIVIYSKWYSVGPLGKIMFLLLPMSLLYALSAVLSKKERYGEIGNVTLGLGSFILPFCIGTVICQTKLIEEINPLVIFLSALLSLPVFVILEYLFKKIFIGVFTVIALYVAYFALAANYRLELIPILWLTVLLSLIILAIGFLLIKNQKSNASIYTVFGTIATLVALPVSVLYTINEQRPLSFEIDSLIISLFGILDLAIASLYYFLYKKFNHHSLYSLKRIVEEIALIVVLFPWVTLGFSKVGYSALALALSALMIFSSTKIWINSLLYVGSLGVIITVLSITSNIFADSIGWPIVVFAAGFASIGIGLLIRKLIKERKETGTLPILFGLGIDPNEKPTHFSVGRIILILLLILFGMPLIVYLLFMFSRDAFNGRKEKVPSGQIEEYKQTEEQIIPEVKKQETAPAPSQSSIFDGFVSVLRYDPLNLNDKRKNINLYDVNEIWLSDKETGDYPHTFLIVSETEFEAKGVKVPKDDSLVTYQDKYKKAKVEYTQYNYPNGGYDYIAKKVIFY